MRIRINITSVLVDDQAKALAFYTDKLGFELKHDVPAGEARWLTLTSPGDPDGVELLLEPDANFGAPEFKSTLKSAGFPTRSSRWTTCRRRSTSCARRVWSSPWNPRTLVR